MFVINCILAIGLINCANSPSQSINKKMFYTNNFYFDTTATYQNLSANSVLNWYYTTNFPPSLLGNNAVQFLTTDSISITPLNNKISYQVKISTYNVASITFKLTTQMISNIQYINIRYALMLNYPALRFTFTPIQIYTLPLEIILPSGSSVSYAADHTVFLFNYNSSLKYSSYYVITGFNITATSSNLQYCLMLTNFEIDSTYFTLTGKNGGNQPIYIYQIDVLILVYATEYYSLPGGPIVIVDWFASTYNTLPLSYTALNQSFNNNNILVGLSRFGIINQNSLNFQLTVSTNHVNIATNNTYELYNFTVFYLTSYYCSQDYPYLLQTSNSCFLSCPSTYFNNQIQLTCDVCQLPCITCQTLTQCLSCTKGYYYDGINSCIQCIANCFTCTNTSSCLVCQDGTNYNNQSNICQKNSDSSNLILIIVICVPIGVSFVIIIIVVWCYCKKKMCFQNQDNIDNNLLRINASHLHLQNNQNNQIIINDALMSCLVNQIDQRRKSAKQEKNEYQKYLNNQRSKPISQFHTKQESNFPSSNQLKSAQRTEFKSQQKLPSQQSTYDCNAQHQEKDIIDTQNNKVQKIIAKTHKILQTQQQPYNSQEKARLGIKPYKSYSLTSFSKTSGNYKQQYIQKCKISDQDNIINQDQIKIQKQLIGQVYQGQNKYQTIFYKKQNSHLSIPSHLSQQSFISKIKIANQKNILMHRQKQPIGPPLKQPSSIINDSRISQINKIMHRQIPQPALNCEPIKIKLPQAYHRRRQGNCL